MMLGEEVDSPSPCGTLSRAHGDVGLHDALVCSRLFAFAHACNQCLANDALHE